MDLAPLLADHPEVAAWVLKTPNDTVANVFLLGYTAYTTGLSEYFRTFNKADEWCLDALKAEVAELKRTIAVAEADADTASFEERVAKRVRQETQALEADAVYAQQQLQRMRQELDARIEDAVGSRLLLATATLQADLQSKERLVQTLEDAARSQVAKARDETEYYKAKWEQSSRDALALGHKIADNTHSEELNKLRAEIQVLKGSNSVKGRVGEALLQTVFQSTLTDWTVNNTGKTAHESDLHLINAAGEIIMVESKNKDSIAKTDMDKFVADMDYMHESKRPWIGSIFVSIRTPNIPHKGSMRLELVHERPVLYLGFRSEDELTSQLPLFTRVFVQYCHQSAATRIADPSNTAAAAADAINGLYAAVNNHFQMLQTMKTHLAKLQKHHREETASIAELEKSLHTLSACMEEFLNKGTNANAHPTPRSLTVTSPASRANIYMCTTCSETFTNKKTHAVHVKSHNGVATPCDAF